MIKLYDQFSFSARVDSTLVKVCASVKHATEIEMSYIKGGESHFPSGDMVVSIKKEE